MDKRVDFFIVGAMRSGTSSLRDALARDRRIGMAKGEPLFFSHNKNYRMGLEAYHALFNWKRGTLRGEKSPTYSVVDRTVGRLVDYNPDAKIIWTLRDPVKRAVSHFQHSRFRTPEALSIEDAIRDRNELERKRSTMAYVYRSEYHKHIERWLQFFPRGQHHFVIFEELIADPEKEMERVYRFLDLEQPRLWQRRISLPGLPRSVNRKMQAHAKRSRPDSAVIDGLKEVLQPTVGAVESLLDRQIPDWG